VTRPLEITPTRNWGGQGALGCTLGYGALHKIPAPLGEPPSAPGETMFETPLDEKHGLEEASQVEPEVNFSGIVPAEIYSQQPVQPKKEKKEKKQRNTHASPSAEMDDYFREEEEKSRKQDGAAGSKASSVPPPPKATSPAPPPPKK
jgi:hypothetical protein